MSTAVKSPTLNRPGATCKVKFVRMSASKVRIVMKLIRGKSVTEAAEILHHSERLAAQNISKAIRSAIANANHNDEIPTEELFVSECFADEGPTLKRFRPRARGRAGRIHKQTCHITITVSRYTDDELDVMRKRDELKGSSKRDASADRRARVARSKGDKSDAEDATKADDAEAIAEDAVEKGPVISAAGTAAASDTADAETPEVESETLDSDADGEVNATDESPYGDDSRAATEDDEMPDGFPIKGNDSSKLYHVPGSSFYDRTKAEVWFASEAAAVAAGFLKPASQRDDADAGEETEAGDASDKGDA